MMCCYVEICIANVNTSPSHHNNTSPSHHLNITSHISPSHHNNTSP
ncbi:MAG: hypothetical protein MR461_05000 [Prevotella sp.]|nr:hypothetical protein [Prevotella sp.]